MNISKKEEEVLIKLINEWGWEKLTQQDDAEFLEQALSLRDQLNYIIENELV